MSPVTPNRRKLDRWLPRLDDASSDTRDAAIETIVEVARDEPLLRDEVLSILAGIFKARPDDAHSVIWTVDQYLDPHVVASSIELLRAIVLVSGEFHTGGNFAMLLLWKLLDSGAMTKAHPLIHDVRSGAARYLASSNPNERDSAFRIVDWCEDNLVE